MYDPDHPEASLVWRDGQFIDIAIGNMEKTGNEVVEMNRKEDKDNELKEEEKVRRMALSYEEPINCPKQNKNGEVRRMALSYKANLF